MKARYENKAAEWVRRVVLAVLLAVLLFSAFTGWNRKYAKDEAPAA